MVVNALPDTSRVRLVATDLDGTLLDGDGLISPRTARALLDAEAAGITVVFVTGRPLRWMDELWTHVGDHGLAICSNGGVVYDAAAHRVVRARPISTSTVLDVAARISEVAPGTAYALEKLRGGYVEPGFAPGRPKPPDVRVAPLRDLLDEPQGVVVKLLALDEGREPEEYWRLVEDAVGDRVTTTWSAFGPLVEMSGVGVSKASTLERLCASRGIGASEVLALGDMPNDLPMLSWAGVSYAMGNAHPSVRAMADHVAPHHAQHGVAQVIEELLAR
ncbi:Cof-type HAD-IIB family hydrolase [Nocardioidaceae bacterium]|nr:Cof-type HAD-IIB family hydrolase [Nocardioidaceae bacterium]